MPNLSPPRGKQRRKEGRHESGALGLKGLQDVMCCFDSHTTHVTPWPLTSSSLLYYNVALKCSCWMPKQCWCSNERSLHFLQLFFSLKSWSPFLINIFLQIGSNRWAIKRMWKSPKLCNSKMQKFDELWRPQKLLLKWLDMFLPPFICCCNWNTKHV